MKMGWIHSENGENQFACIKIEENGEPGVRSAWFEHKTCGKAVLMLQTKQKGIIFYKINEDGMNPFRKWWESICMRKIDEIGEPVVRPAWFEHKTCGEAALMLQTKQKTDYSIKQMKMGWIQSKNGENQFACIKIGEIGKPGVRPAWFLRKYVE